MKRLFFISLLAAALCLSLSTTSPAQDGVMINDEVISLTKAGLSPSIIIGKIRSGKSNFDLSTDSLIKLKQAGVTDDVVTAMLEAKGRKPTAAGSPTSGDPDDPAAAHSFGIYLFEETAGVRKMTRLQPNVSAQNRTGGLF